MQLPVDMDSLDEKERLNLWVSRKKKRSAIDSDYLDTTFDAETYTQYWKKWHVESVFLNAYYSFFLAFSIQITPFAMVQLFYVSCHGVME